MAITPSLTGRAKGLGRLRHAAAMKAHGTSRSSSPPGPPTWRMDRPSLGRGAWITLAATATHCACPAPTSTTFTSCRRRCRADTPRTKHSTLSADRPQVEPRPPPLQAARCAGRGAGWSAPKTMLAMVTRANIVDKGRRSEASNSTENTWSDLRCQFELFCELPGRTEQAVAGTLLEVQRHVRRSAAAKDLDEQLSVWPSPLMFSHVETPSIDYLAHSDRRRGASSSSEPGSCRAVRWASPSPVCTGAEERGIRIPKMKSNDCFRGSLAQSSKSARARHSERASKLSPMPRCVGQRLRGAGGATAVPGQERVPTKGSLKAAQFGWTKPAGALSCSPLWSSSRPTPVGQGATRYSRG